MAIFDRVKFDAPSNDYFVWKFPSEDLKLGSQLIVAPSQEAIFVKQGRGLDLFGPGPHTLSTKNLPLLSGLIKFPFGGDTPFTAEVWFVNKFTKRDLDWGTPKPAQFIDPILSFPLSLRAFGKWGITIADSRAFVEYVTGTVKETTADDIAKFLIGEVVQHLIVSVVAFMSERRVSFFQLAQYLNEISSATLNPLRGTAAKYGIEVVSFNIESISIPEEEQQMIQRAMIGRVEMDQLSESVPSEAYRLKKTFDVLEKAGEQGGTGGTLLAAGLGMATVGPLIQPLSSELSRPSGGDVTTKLLQIKRLRQQDLITEEEFQQKRKELLAQL